MRAARVRTGRGRARVFCARSGGRAVKFARGDLKLGNCKAILILGSSLIGSALVARRFLIDATSFSLLRRQLAIFEEVINRRSKVAAFKSNYFFQQL